MLARKTNLNVLFTFMAGSTRAREMKTRDARELRNEVVYMRLPSTLTACSKEYKNYIAVSKQNFTSTFSELSWFV